MKTKVSKFSKLNIIRPPMPWHKPRVRDVTDQENPDTVILLHGLWRSIWAMEPMAKFLHSEGYHTVNIPYPSFTKPLDFITKHVEKHIQTHSGNGKINLVTHSLGGIIARELLDQLPPERMGRLVMLAPPNQGSEIIDWLAKSPAVSSLFGPAGMNLATNKVSSPHLPDHVDSAVIMGNRSLIPFFKTMLDDDNDGIVSVERGKIEGMNEFRVINADHTFIASEPEVMNITKQFLANSDSE